MNENLNEKFNENYTIIQETSNASNEKLQISQIVNKMEIQVNDQFEKVEQKFEKVEQRFDQKFERVKNDV